MILCSIQEILFCYKSEVASNNKSETTDSTSYVSSTTRAAWCDTAQFVLKAFDGTKVCNSFMMIYTADYIT
jgi:hypothetical protein